MKQFKQTHGRFPKHNPDDQDDQDDEDDEDHEEAGPRGCATAATEDRTNKLVLLAFGDRWQPECFPNTIRKLVTTTDIPETTHRSRNRPG